MSKKVILCLFVYFVSSTVWSQQKKITVRDSIQVVYDSLFYCLEKDYLYKEQVDWKKLKPYVLKKALNAKSLKGAFDVTMSELFDTINGSHLNIISKQGWYKSTLGKPFEQEDFNLEFLQKYVKNSGFETKILDNKYGYVFIPGMLLDVPQDSINRKTQQMYDAIAKIAKNKNVEGWIIDLRMNIGGNAIPMLASLHYFLGNQPIYTVRGPDDTIIELNRLKDAGYYDEGELLAKAVPSINPNTTIPVVLVTGLLTSSAGELIPVSFRKRENVLVVGEPTYGRLTGNEMAKLPFGVKITLTTGYLSDRTGKYTPNIKPEIHINKGDNYTDLLKDKNVIEAIKFIESKKE